MRNVSKISSCLALICAGISTASCATGSESAHTAEQLSIYYTRPNVLMRSRQEATDIRRNAMTSVRTTDQSAIGRISTELNRNCHAGIQFTDMDVRVVFDFRTNGMDETWIGDGDRVLNLAKNMECKLDMAALNIW